MYRASAGTPLSSDSFTSTEAPERAVNSAQVAKVPSVSAIPEQHVRKMLFILQVTVAVRIRPPGHDSTAFSYTVGHDRKSLIVRNPKDASSEKVVVNWCFLGLKSTDTFSRQGTPILCRPSIRSRRQATSRF